MLRDAKSVAEAREQLPVKKAYSDPFVHDQKRYSEFLRRLSASGMLRWRRALPGEVGEMGIFCVAKKSGQLRLIFDTRIVNSRLHPAPRTPLPSPASFAALEVAEGSTLYGAGGDVRNYFYMVGIPTALSDLFTLPGCRAGLLGLEGADLGDGPLHFNTVVMPCVTVLPMGFSWALLSIGHCSGRVMEKIIGHLTWALLLKRPALSLLGSVYGFARVCRNFDAPLWGSVREELSRAIDILPLVTAELGKWSSTVTASDSSGFAIGVCRRDLDPARVGSIGRECEKWRYDFESAARARSHALSELAWSEDSGTGGHGRDLAGESSARRELISWTRREGFSEVDREILEPSAWRVCWAARLRHAENILAPCMDVVSPTSTQRRQLLPSKALADCRQHATVFGHQ